MKTSISRYVLAFLLVCTMPLAWGQQITVHTLLDEYLDPERIAQLPDPWYITGLASSYDRTSQLPPNDADWWANGDFGQFIRTETNQGRTEYVLMDQAGPGCITRIWSALPDGVLRVYLDGADTPVIEESMAPLLTGGIAPFDPPLSYVVAEGKNLYFPIPYETHCKVTCDANPGIGLFYHINYRTYEPGTDVVSFTNADRTDTATLNRIASVSALLENPSSLYAPSASADQHSGNLTVASAAFTHTASEPRVIRELRLKPASTDEASLRQVLLRISFDGEDTVVAPLGDFFGTGPGLNPYTSLMAEVQSDGTLICRWPMPFQTSFSIALEGDDTFLCEYDIATEPWNWTDRSLHFSAYWHKDHEVSGHGPRDWNYITVTGTGIYAGNTLNIANPVIGWWGEGDERIYVDGEAWPSHFGTGTEDYYGYAWCSPELFEHAFHNQTRVDGPGNYGHSSVNRWHYADPIPFAASIRFDMEQLFVATDAKACLYDVVNYWYARPGATHNLPEITTADLTFPEIPPLVEKQIAGTVIEGEDMQVVSSTPNTGPQGMTLYETETRLWSNHTHRFWWGASIGDALKLRFGVPEAGTYKVYAYLTKAPDYGIVSLSVDGEPTGVEVDLFDHAVVPTEAVYLGVYSLPTGSHEITLHMAGANPSAIENYAAGLDCLALVPHVREIEGTVFEGEDMGVSTTDGATAYQNMLPWTDTLKVWSNHAQVFWNEAGPGDQIALTFGAPQAGIYTVDAYFTQAADYGVVDLSLNGNPVVAGVDLYADGVVPSEPVHLGTHNLVSTDNVLEATIAGTNPAAIPGYRFGLDCLALKKPPILSDVPHFTLY